MVPISPTLDSCSARAETEYNNAFRTYHREEALYINVTVRDHSEAVQRKVEKKIDRSSLPHPIKALAKRSAPRLASEVATPADTALGVSRKLADKIPRKLRERGIRADVVPVYRQGPYVVMKLTVRHVDVLRLVNAVELATHPRTLQPTNAGTRDAAFATPPGTKPLDTLTVGAAFQALWSALFQRNDRKGLSRNSDVWPKFLTAMWVMVFALAGSRGKNWLETSLIPGIVQRRMVPSLQTMLEGNLERKRLVAEGVVLNEADQCRYFYSHLSRLEDERIEGTKGLRLALPAPALTPISALRPRIVA
jgi:hypothetical protein